MRCSTSIHRRHSARYDLALPWPLVGALTCTPGYASTLCSTGAVSCSGHMGPARWSNSCCASSISCLRAGRQQQVQHFHSCGVVSSLCTIPCAPYARRITASKQGSAASMHHSQGQGHETQLQAAAPAAAHPRPGASPCCMAASALLVMLWLMGPSSACSAWSLSCAPQLELSGSAPPSAGLLPSRMMPASGTTKVTHADHAHCCCCVWMWLLLLLRQLQLLQLWCCCHVALQVRATHSPGHRVGCLQAGEDGCGAL
jgi:hypothetical protein